MVCGLKPSGVRPQTKWRFTLPLRRSDLPDSMLYLSDFNDLGSFGQPSRARRSGYAPQPKKQKSTEQDHC